MSFAPTPASLPPKHVVYRFNEPKGLPVNYHPLNPVQFLLKAALLHPDKLALASPDGPHPVYYSFAVWAQRVQNLAYALIQARIRPGDRVAVIAPNSPMIADSYFGVLAARAIVCAVNTRLRPDDVKYIIEHSGSRFILVDHEFTHLLKGINLPHYPGDPYEDFLTSGRAFSRERGWLGLDVEADENAAAVLCYTCPKGVLTTYRGSYLAAIANAVEAEMNYDSVYLWIVPLFHAAGWCYAWSAAFAFSTQVTLRTAAPGPIWQRLLAPPSGGIETVPGQLLSHIPAATHYCAAPTVQISLVNATEARRVAHSVRTIVAGSAPTSSLIASLESLGIRVVHVYGLTETYGPFVRSYARPHWKDLSLEERAKLMARQGHAFATALEARVVYPPKDGESDDGELVDVPKDGKTIGEIVTRGNIVMKEYLNDPKATRKAFRGNHFNTGDLAVWFEDGSIQVMDRSKDIIISGGENASSLAIEQELATHPALQEVSVIARTHPKWGERPMAFVILRPGARKQWGADCGAKGKDTNGKQQPSAFERELKAYAKGRLPGFACPEWVEVVDELPKTSTGKIQKHELRKVVAKL
ncbi:acetyl-CoA synthetase-like protein [Schizophyllum commune H4-8]|uniref:acetyl-CoA synthetase-like protein n=1 Tax=Schizophyllum commune (strain H4-8 / FGSC 9210) TaxID=578458 RepID=UPI00215E5EB4|nr:acetyl-CoA synthetase-like protein [Schizophyllum commune H4-8]KAI5897672.1 acetyl-CoA synthetase-like protein [Schizophyllum commune H4-8]